MSRREIQNARIRSVVLGREDHGIPTAFVYLDYDGAGQGFGGYSLQGAAMSAFVMGVLDTLEVESWEKLPGTPCRSDCDFGKVHRIGHFLKDKWFDPAATFAASRSAAAEGKAAP